MSTNHQQTPSESLRMQIPASDSSCALEVDKIPPQLHFDSLSDEDSSISSCLSTLHNGHYDRHFFSETSCLTFPDLEWIDQFDENNVIHLQSSHPLQRLPFTEESFFSFEFSQFFDHDLNSSCTIFCNNSTPSKPALQWIEEFNLEFPECAHDTGSTMDGTSTDSDVTEKRVKRTLKHLDEIVPFL